jgi:hypothetical protein
MNSDGTANPLPEELARALRRATDRTISALTSLRKAVLEHVSNERERGASLEEIKVDLQEIISRVRDSAGKDGNANGNGNGNGHGNGHHHWDGEQTIAAEVIKWTDGFYKRSD